MLNYKVIFLTGPPASGKTTLAAELRKHVTPLEVFDFGRLLLESKQQDDPSLTYEKLRADSAFLIKPSDVVAADDYLLHTVKRLRTQTNILVDSHAVTREHFGFRITASNQQLLSTIGLDGVIVLRCLPRERIQRISSDPQGRLAISEEEANTHQALQDAVAVAYGVIAPCPVFILDAAGEPVALAMKAASILNLLGASYAWLD